MRMYMLVVSLYTPCVLKLSSTFLTGWARGQMLGDEEMLPLPGQITGFRLRWGSGS